MGQFGRCETTVLSGPGICPLTDCHPGVNFSQEMTHGDGKLHLMSIFLNCSAGAHPAEVSSAFFMEGTGA